MFVSSNLCPDPEVVVLYKWRRLQVAGLRENEGADVGENDHRTGGKDKQILPEFPIWYNVMIELVTTSWSFYSIDTCVTMAPAWHGPDHRSRGQCLAPGSEEGGHKWSEQHPDDTSFCQVLSLFNLSPLLSLNWPYCCQIKDWVIEMTFLAKRVEAPDQI